MRTYCRVPDEQALLEQEEETHGGPWPEWVSLEHVAGRVAELAPVYAKLSPADVTALGRELGHLLSGVAGAHLTDDARNDSSKAARQAYASAVEALSSGLALGSVCPGGAKLWGVWFEHVDDITHMRILTHGTTE